MRLLAVLLASILPLACAPREPTKPWPAECPNEVCAVTAEDAPAAPAVSAESLVFFWAAGCSACEQAESFVRELAREHPAMAVERIEVKENAAGRARFLATARELGIEAPGVPTFVHGSRYVVGYRVGLTEARVRAMLTGETHGAERISLPWLGDIDPSSLPLPAFTLLVGLVDGINPCALWVLMVLLGILLHVRSRGRMLLYGTIFVLTSGVVYFAFMTAWTHMFALLGLSRAITMALGALVLLLGLVNLKEILWFKKGVSLMVPERVKPVLYRRMRAIARSTSLPAAIVGIVTLALLVNLVELGCTIGLPAVYTRILTLRSELTSVARYAYLALYNFAYVVPLATVVGVFVVTFRRVALSERGAKMLKGVSGALLVLFGLVLLAAPGLLG